MMLSSTEPEMSMKVCPNPRQTHKIATFFSIYQNIAYAT